jgi:hypothetical protein
MINETIFIGLSSWIIQDGNYPDFLAGTDAAFALEFYAASGLRKAEGPVRPQLQHIIGPEYEAIGRIIYISDDWWVIDFGIPAFQDSKPPDTLRLGDEVRGRITLGIDPFFYFERLALRPGAPALVADWHVKRIQIQTAPFIQQGNMMLRDEALFGWRDITKTDAWKDDGGLGEYLLTCEVLSPKLRHAR